MDPIADFIIQIKNGGKARKESVMIPYSKMKHTIAEVLLKTGFIKSYAKKTKKNFPVLEIGLLYVGGQPRIEDVSRISKPSKRVYFGVKDIPKVKYGHGALILSTPKGILTDREAVKEMVGGEALFKIW